MLAGGLFCAQMQTEAESIISKAKRPNSFAKQSVLGRFPRGHGTWKGGFQYHC
jgi:hypothetical protein